jgi:hypothetical protein
MRKRIRKEELLFDVNDTAKIKLGKDLHIPDYDFVIDPSTGVNSKIDRSIESLLLAMEIAEENGFEHIYIPDTVMTYSLTFYCKINGEIYYVKESRKEECGGIDYKIKKV